MNNRANIMYFIEQLCDMAQRENHMEFVRMMQRDILRVMDAVAPADGSGAANVKVVKKVLKGLEQKQLLLPQTVVELEECLKDRDAVQTMEAAVPSPVLKRDGSTTGTPSIAARNGVGRPGKRQIEQRIEEDRERHKRSRESIWAVSGEEGEEFEKLWEETSDIGEDDFIVAEEDFVERKHTIDVERMFVREPPA